MRKFFKDNQIKKLNLTEIIRSLAHSSLGIFLPIFILTNGATLTELSLFFIALFGITYISGFIVIAFFNKNANLVMFISMIIRGIFYYSLYIYANWQILAITFGVAVGAYWYIIDLSLLYLPKSKKGLTIGIFYGLMSASSIIGPILGGFVISYFGYNQLFIYVIILLIPTAISAYLVGKYEWKFAPIKLSFLKNFIKSRHGKLFLVFVPIYGIIFMQNMFYYPLLLNQVTGTIFGMGVIQTIINILVTLSYLFAGKIFDLKKGKTVLTIAMFIIGLALIGIGYSNTIETFTILSWISNFGYALIASPFWALISCSTSKENLVSMVLITNFLLVIGRITAIALLNPLLVIGNFQIIYLTIGILSLIGMGVISLLPNTLFRNINQVE